MKIVNKVSIILASMILLSASIVQAELEIPSGYELLNYDFEDSRTDSWGFSKTGSDFNVLCTEINGNHWMQFKGGNATGNPGISLLAVPEQNLGSSYEVAFDVYHPLADTGDTFIRFTDDKDKDIFSFYLRESGDAANIAGKTMRYGLNTVLGSNSLGENSTGSAKLTTTPETGSVGPNGVTYHVYSKMDFVTKKQTLIVTDTSNDDVVVNISDADIKNASSLSYIKIGYGYISGSYDGVYLDNLIITTDPDDDIVISDFEMNKGSVQSQITNVSGKELNVTLGYGIYNTDGTLNYLNCKTETLSSVKGLNSYTFSDTIEFAENTIEEVKLFVWDSETMKPLTPLKSVTDSGEILDIASMVQPVPKKNQLLDDGYYTWCGSYIKGNDGKYHVYYSRWKLEYGFVSGWVSHSEIAHAVSDNIDGPYIFKDVVIGPRGREYWDGTTAHNPYILEIDGKYYLYYMGTTAPENVSETPLPYKEDWYEYRNRQQIGVAVSDSPNGPWERYDEPVHKPDKTLNEDNSTKWDSMIVNNPALTQMPDGKILMIYKGVQDTTGGDTSKPNGVVKIGAAIADNPMGPFEKVGGLLFEGNGTIAAEDPFVWYSQTRKKYYAIVRDAAGSFTGTKGSLVLFESTDGVSDWGPSKNILVLTNYFEWDDGTRNASQVERPWMLFDEEENPQMLFGATRINGSENFTTNVFIPLTKK